FSLCFFFFFHWSRYHQDLHSFPTRRSSDLKPVCNYPKQVFQNSFRPNPCNWKKSFYPQQIILWFYPNYQLILPQQFLWIFLVLRSEEHTSELQSRENLVCRLLLEKKKKKRK